MGAGSIEVLRVVYETCRINAEARLGGGTELVLVTLPLSEAATVAWPLADGSVTSMTSGGLTVLADLAQMLEGLEEAPPVVVVVGGVQPKELRPVLSIGLGERRPMQWTPDSVPLIEGGVDRRLGAPGSEAQLRLEMMLPAPDDWRRSPLEVLWELLPELDSTATWRASRAASTPRSPTSSCAGCDSSSRGSRRIRRSIPRR